MLWALVIVVVIAVIWYGIKNDSDNAQPEVEIKPSRPWKKPVSPEEHLIFFASMCELFSAFDDLPKLTVLYSWGPGRYDKVTLTFYGIDTTSIYNNTPAVRYLQSLSGDGITACCEFEFPNATGAPYYFRTNDSVLEYIQSYAPHAYIDERLSSSDFTHIAFSKHSLAPKPSYPLE